MRSERAKKYLNRVYKPMSNIQRRVKIYDRNMVEKAIEFAEQDTEERVRTELKYFHTPRELPPNDKEVLGVINRSYNHYVVLKHNDLGWWMPAVVGGWCVCPFSVLAWREIIE